MNDTGTLDQRREALEAFRVQLVTQLLADSLGRQKTGRKSDMTIGRLNRSLGHLPVYTGHKEA